MHDPLAAALAVGALKPALAPVVRAAVDTSDGPGRGQAVCDMRGLYAGYPEVKGARCRVVLSLEEDFAPHLVDTLLNHFELTTAAVASAGFVAQQMLPSQSFQF